MGLDAIGIGAVADLAGKVLDKFIPDPAAKAQAQLELLRMQQSGELAQLAATTDLAKGQLAVNAAEAASASLFVAGWRPAIGWVCAIALFYEFLIRPLLTFANGTPAPELDMTDLYSLLTGMLGLGGLRTIEKIKGVSK